MSRSPEILAFLLAPGAPDSLPLRLHSLGRHDQTHIYRPGGFPHSQLLWSTEGSGSFECFNQPAFNLPAGYALYLPGGVPHEYSPRGGSWLLSFLSFDGSAADTIARGSGMFPCTPFRLFTCEEELQLRLEQMWQGIYAGTGISGRRYSSLLYEMLMTVGEAAAADQPQPKQDEPGRVAIGAHSSPTPAELALRQALRLMDHHYTEQLDMSNLARTVGYSVQHFQRLFKQACGMPPHVYLQRLRLHRSLEWLLEEPPLSIRDVAARLGWEANYYIRVFREHYGVSPGQYRRSGEQAKNPPHRPEGTTEGD